MKERWKPVVGFEGLYEVSNLGRVYSLITSRVLRESGTQSYAHVVLRRGGKSHTRNVHVIVLEAFKGLRPSSHHESNHKDGNTKNNKLRNLEWTTKSKNQEHKCHTLGLTTKEYIVVDPKGNKHKVKGLGKFCDENGLSRAYMFTVASGKKNSYKGWKCKRL